MLHLYKFPKLKKKRLYHFPIFTTKSKVMFFVHNLEKLYKDVTVL